VGGGVSGIGLCYAPTRLKWRFGVGTRKPTQGPGAGNLTGRGQGTFGVVVDCENIFRSGNLLIHESMLNGHIQVEDRHQAPLDTYLLPQAARNSGQLALPAARSGQALDQSNCPPTPCVAKSVTPKFPHSGRRPGDLPLFASLDFGG